MTPVRIAAIATASVIALTGLWSTWFWARLPSRLPTDADYTRANEVISAARRDGDIIVLAPAYADRGRQFLTSLPVYSGFDLAHDEYPGTRRQWLVALPDLPRFSLDEAREMLLKRGKNEEGQRIGELWVEPFDIAGPPVAYSFLDSMAKADVTIEGQQIHPCPLARNGAHQCSGQDWNKVQPGWFEVQERPAHCIWAHPVGREPLTIRFHDVPMPEGSRIAGWGALVGQAAATLGAPVDLAIEVNDQLKARVQFPNQFGKQRFGEPIHLSASGTASVTFRVTAENAGMRHFCFDAWVQPPG